MSRIVPRLRPLPAAATITATIPPPPPPPTAFLFPISSLHRQTRPWVRYIASHVERHGENGAQKRYHSRNDGDDDDGKVGASRRSDATFTSGGHILIGGLVVAGTCRRRHRTGDGPSRHVLPHARCFSAITFRRRQTGAVPPDTPDSPGITREQYRRLVDFYHVSSDKLDQEEKIHAPLVSRFFIIAEQEKAEEQQNRLTPPSSKRTVLPPRKGGQAAIVKELRHLIKVSALGRVSLDQLWDLYGRLFAPRPRFLSDADLRRLLLHLGFVEHWYEPNAMIRYFQLLNDCIAQRVPIDDHIWTTAVSFAGRWTKHVTDAEVKGAIETWTRMEEAGHSADHVTLNVLFDVAVKAGRFALADTLYKEIRTRKMPLDRYFRGSLIYYAGMKRNGDDVRRAFREFVAAGEIVDTGVMNAVILSLLRAGEVAAAEQVLLRMKRLAAEKISVPSPVDWQDRKQLQAELNAAAQRLRAEKEGHESSFFGASFSSEERLEQIQQQTPIAPDSTTYTFLLQYHGNTTGNAERVWQILQEMSIRGLRVPPAAYVHILRGFRLHGGYALSGWNHPQLERCWKMILRDLESDDAEAILRRPASEPQQAEDYDMLGAMLSHHAGLQYDIAQTPTDARTASPDEQMPDMHPSASKPLSATTSALPSFLDSVSLQHLTNAALLPEGEGGGGEEEKVEDTSPPSRPEMVGESSSARSRARQAQIRTSDTGHSSFLDSLSLRHLTDAALLPEGGTPIEEVVAAEDVERLDESSHRRFEPVGAVDSTPKVVVGSNGRSVVVDEDDDDDDSFDSNPIWRRERFPMHRDDPRLVSRVTAAATSLSPASSSSSSRTQAAEPDEGSPEEGSAGSRYAPPPGQKRVALSYSMAVEAVRAFYQCCGRERMQQVWEQISVLWHDASEAERVGVENEVRRMARHASRYEQMDERRRHQQ